MWLFVYLCFVKQKTAYEMRISDWSSDVCSSDRGAQSRHAAPGGGGMRQIGAHVSVPYLRIVEHVGDIVDRPCRNGRRFAPREQIGAGDGGGALHQRGDEGDAVLRSEERRVGKECACTCGPRGSPIP